MPLKAGMPAPDFDLATDGGSRISLKSLRGKKVVLFFYPKDDTPGCTKESCEFRDLTPEFDANNAAIFGISADDVDSHKAFVKKYNLNFPLLADTTKAICKAYDVWGMQEWNGRKFEGIARTTYLIDEKGMIKKVYEKVDPSGHAQKVLADL